MANKKIRQNFVQWMISVRSGSANPSSSLALCDANGARRDWLWGSRSLAEIPSLFFVQVMNRVI
jgi:hypothetical protein